MVLTDCGLDFRFEEDGSGVEGARGGSKVIEEEPEAYSAALETARYSMRLMPLDLIPQVLIALRSKTPASRMLGYVFKHMVLLRTGTRTRFCLKPVECHSHFSTHSMPLVRSGERLRSMLICGATFQNRQQQR